MKGFLRSRVASNAMWIIAGRVVQSLLMLIVGMLTARYLGPSNYGMIGYAASIVAFVMPLMNLGLSNVLVQELTNYPEEEGRILGSAVLLSFFSAVACIVGVGAYTCLVDVNETGTNYVVILYSIMLVFQAFELVQYWFQAKLLSKYVSMVGFIALTVVSAYKILLLTQGASIYFFAISNSLDYFLIGVFLIITYKRLGGQRLEFSKETARRMLTTSKYYIVSGLMVTVFAQTDRIMLKLMLNETAVGYYSAAVTCAGMTSFVFVAIIDSLRPSIFLHKKQGDTDSYERTLTGAYGVIIYLSLTQSIVMTLLSKFIIGILFGADYAPSVSALRIVVWYTTFSYLGAVRNIWILGENKQKYLWILNLGGAGANVLLNAILIPFMGINGAALASLITQFFTNIVMNVVVWPLSYNNRMIWRGLNPKLIARMLGKFRLSKDKL